MMDIDEAQRIVLAQVHPLESVEVSLGESLYRTLASVVRSDVDDPPFDKAVMDGYAVRAADVLQVPVTFPVSGHVAAGRQPDTPLEAGRAIQINTGAPIPAGADAVVRVEDTEVIPSPGGGQSPSNQVLIKQSVGPGNFVTKRAAHIRAGDVVLQRGTYLTPLAIAAAGTSGAASVTVHRTPRVAVLATGDELVSVADKPQGPQIRNSNSVLLQSLFRAARLPSENLGMVGDDRAALAEKIETGLKSDVFCITGGVSMGAFDFVPDVLAACGVTFLVRKVAIKPGRPTIVARAPSGTFVFALPGNPASAFVAFELLVRPTLAALQGRPRAIAMPVRVKLEGAVGRTRDRRTYLPAAVRVDDDQGLIVEPTVWRGSGDMLGMAYANALIVRQPHAEKASSGEMVSTLLLERV